MKKIKTWFQSALTGRFMSKASAKLNPGEAMARKSPANRPLDPTGYRAKFNVTRSDGKPFNHAPDAFVVMCFDTDPHAAEAVKVYAHSIAHENPQFSADLIVALAKAGRYV